MCFLCERSIPKHNITLFINHETSKLWKTNRNYQYGFHRLYVMCVLIQEVGNQSSKTQKSILLSSILVTQK